MTADEDVEKVKAAVRMEWGSRLCGLDAFAKRPCEYIIGHPCACLDVARAAIAAMPGWCDISSAPRDGTTILAVKGDAEIPDVCVAHFRNGKWVCMTTEDWDAADEGWRDHAWYFAPTHWMPRPQPPEGEQ
jgi:hypothetical protein